MLQTVLCRLANSPVMVGENRQTAFLANFQSMHEKVQSLSAEQQQQIARADGSYDHDFWPEEGSFLSMFRPYNVKNGVLVIPVAGSLINDFTLTLFGMVTGYQYIEKAVERGMADGDVHTILFKINSPGGEVSGCFDLSDYIVSFRGTKPMISAIADHAYSAAFNIAAATDRRYIDRVGGSGSVGVLTMHVDMSEMLKKMGLDVKYIYSGSHKVDGNPYEPLPEPVEKRIQSRIDGLREMFATTVANNLGMDVQKVKDTEALTYTAEESLEVGFADEIASFSETLTAQSSNQAQQGASMSTETEKPKASEAASQESLDAARQEGYAAGKQEGMAEGAKAERERITSILGSEEAKARPKAALATALKSNQSVDNAKAFLADMPEEKAASAGGDGNHFERAMSHDNPNVDGGDGPAATAEDDPDAQANTILGTYRAATGQSSASKQ